MSETKYTLTQRATQPLNSSADIIPFERLNTPVVREDFTLAIQEFCLKRNFEDALCREEIGRLEKFSRVDAQRKALLINMSHYYRDNPRADVAPGVLTIITLLSDNDKGACTLSQAQIALILYRTRTTIAEAVTRLKASELVRSVNGKAMSYPTIPRAVAQNYNHVVWVVDALKNVATCPVEPTGGNLSRGADTSSIPVPSKQQVAPSTCRVEGGQPVGSTGHKFTKENSTTLDKAAAVVATGIATAMSSLPVAAAPPEPPAIVQSVMVEIPYEELKAKLMEAGGEAIGETPGLEVLSDPRRWLRAGCDLHEDILPAIRARSAKMPKRSIKSWSYFTQAVADAKAAREAPMPLGTVRQNSPSCGNDRPKTWQEKQDEAYRYLLRK